MLTVRQLHTLLEFYGDHALGVDDSDTERLEEHNALVCMGLLGYSGHKLHHGHYFEVTPLGMRVVRAASGAANEEHGREMARRENEARRATIPKSCLCRGSGWVWAHELPDHSYDGEVDDTQYSCPECREREELNK